MSIVKNSLLSVCVVALAACGEAQDQKKVVPKSHSPAQMTTGQQSTEIDARQAKLPLAGIIRVPIDQNGNERHDQADFRTVTGSKHFSEAQSVSEAFAGGTTPTHVVDELDSDSSTESWYGWGGSCGYGGYGGYGYGGYGSYGYGYGGYNSYYYSAWRPSCNYYGYNYTYGNPSYYSYGDANYYYYPNSYYY
jgi:hypothetical protein